MKKLEKKAWFRLIKATYISVYAFLMTSCAIAVIIDVIRGRFSWGIVIVIPIIMLILTFIKMFFLYVISGKLNLK